MLKKYIYRIALLIFDSISNDNDFLYSAGHIAKIIQGVDSCAQEA
jgi:hypothetical protein